MVASTLLLALGNDIMGDDGAALTAAQHLKARDLEDVDVSDTLEAGLALLEILSGYRRVLLLDTIVTGNHPPGTVLALSQRDFTKVLGSSPHYAGLPEVIELARQLAVAFPLDIRVLALEIEQPTDFSDTLSPLIQAAIPGYVQKAVDILHGWRRAG
ncbi:MAG: hydrogenase maturation protease [Phycisphaeraceae bacterium]|nr:hydrogenase maturation protease [Phycisphaeraceae bacterium]